MKKITKILAILAILLLLFVTAGCDILGNITPPPAGPTNPPVGPTNPPTEQPDNPTDTPGNPTDTPDNPTKPETPFEDYGMKVIEIHLSNVKVVKSGIYTSMTEVGAYLYLYHRLPDNFTVKKYFDRNDYTSANKLSVGGDVFYNREKLLPIKSGRQYYECDIDYRGGSRNAKRIVFSSDWLIFYTADHYESFSILRFFE